MTVTDNTPGTITIEIAAPQTPVRVIEAGGTPGETGDAGADGWSPLLAGVNDGTRRVLMVFDWTGGSGTKPAIGQYVGTTGLVTLIANGLDVRGAVGAAGVQGADGAPGGVIIGTDDEIIVGTGAPDDANGADGQLYFDQTNENLYKKAAGTWGAPKANLKGSTGPKGDKGDDGNQGIPGVAGADGANGASGPAGSVMRFGDGAPTSGLGTNGDQYTDRTTGNVYTKISGSWAFQFTNKGADGISGISGTNGADGTNGTNGADGAPGPTLNPRSVYNVGTTYAKFDDVHVTGEGSYYSLVASNVGHTPSSSPTQWRLYAVDGINGTNGTNGTDGADGADGATGAAGATGATGAAGTNGTDGADGATGAAGTAGIDGWSPVFAVVSDSARRVLQVSDWVGGAGTKPATGSYVGATGLETLIANGVDIRGPTGAAGADGATGAAGAAGINAADFMIFQGGTLANSQRIFKAYTVRAFTLPASLTGSYAKADMAATASYVITLKKNGTSIGTLTWAAAGTTATISFSSSVTFSVGDTFEITGAATADTTLADIEIDLLGSR